MPENQLSAGLVKRLAPCASKGAAGWPSIVVIPHAGGVDALATNGRCAAVVRLDARPSTPANPSAIAREGAEGLRAKDRIFHDPDTGAVRIEHASGASWTLPPAPTIGSDARALPPLPDVLPPTERYAAGVFISPKMLAEALAAVTDSPDAFVFLALPDSGPAAPVVLLGDAGAAIVSQCTEGKPREERWFDVNLEDARKRFLDAHAAARVYSCAIG